MMRITLATMFLTLEELRQRTKDRVNEANMKLYRRKYNHNPKPKAKNGTFNYQEYMREYMRKRTGVKKPRV